MKHPLGNGAQGRPAAILALQDGTMFQGMSIGAAGHTRGEVVFNTAMTGYQEILSDASYTRQIVTLTYPHIGNAGINCEDGESSRVHAAGLVIKDLPLLASNFRSSQDLSAYLAEQGVVAIAGIDTRKLARILREKGAQNGAIAVTDDAARALALARSLPGRNGMDLARVVSTATACEWTETEWRLGAGFGRQEAPRLHVVAYDFGVKTNILRMLAERGCKGTVLPAQAGARGGAGAQAGRHLPVEWPRRPRALRLRDRCGARADRLRRAGIRHLPTQMKSVGEVMAIGRSFQESFQKALRGLDIGVDGVRRADMRTGDDVMADQLARPGPDRIWYVGEAFARGSTLEQVNALTHIDPWFLAQIQDLVEIELWIEQQPLAALDKALMYRLKQQGFGERRLAALLKCDEQSVREQRHALGVRPVYKRVDTCAAEFATDTAYLYSTYDDTPVLFLVWKHAPIKTTLIRELQDLCDVTYVEFEEVDELREGIHRFFNSLQHGDSKLTQFQVTRKTSNVQ